MGTGTSSEKVGGGRSKKENKKSKSISREMYQELTLLVINTGASKKTGGRARSKNADAERDYGRSTESVTREPRTNCGCNTCRCQREDRRRSQKQGQQKGSR
jgi:hypothetical protein